MIRAAAVVLLVALPLGADPTVGELFDPGIALGPGERFLPAESSEWEVVRQPNRPLMIRAFRPGEIVIEGEIVGADETSREVSVTRTIDSVLIDGDVEPSALADPILPETSPLGWILSGVAALMALLAWLPLFRKESEVEQGSALRVPPQAAFLAAIESAKQHSETPLADIADATRSFLVRIEPRLSRELTTSELEQRLRDIEVGRHAASIRFILEVGDLEKFSPWGSDTPLPQVVDRARDLAGLTVRRSAA